jgi:dihydroflavonol-4-reductase
MQPALREFTVPRMTVVVTGASGHLGANLVRQLLARGERVRVLVHRSSAALADIEDQLERAEGSVIEPESLAPAFAGADRVYHLAGVISIDGDPDGRVHRVNVDGTRNVAQACLRAGVGRLIHVSSVHAYDMDPRDETLDEARRQVADSHHHSAYDRSKALGERVVQKAVEQGLDAVIVNPTGILGPVDHGPSRLGQLIGDLANNRVPALLDGGFDFVDVRDVAAGTIAAGEHGRAGANYILGNAWYTLRELAELVASRPTGARVPKLVTPVWAARLGVPLARAAAKLRRSEPLFTRESLEVLVSNRSISSAKARSEIGYTTRPLGETVSDTLAWFARDS